jgi:hypothetical protein
MMTVLFAALIDDSWYGSVYGRLKALALLGAGVRWLIVDPIGYYPAVAVFAVCFSLFCGFFFLGKPEGGSPDQLVQMPDIVQSRQQEPTVVAAPPSRTFGRKSETAPASTTPLKAKIDPVLQTLRAAFEDGFDWYFAHYGFEGNWIPVAAKMAASPEPELVAFAKLLTQAGHLYDQLKEFHYSFYGTGLSEEEADRQIAAKEVPYMAAMRELDREKWKLLPPKEARTGTLAQLNDWL